MLFKHIKLLKNKTLKEICPYYVGNDYLYFLISTYGGQNDFDASDIYLLLCNGVNIFNVDRTIQNEELYQNLKKAVSKATQMPEMFPPQYIRPVALSITMSVNEPIQVDERIDFIIIKHVFCEDQVTEYKRSLKVAIPILLWISPDSTEEIADLVKISDGIVFEFSDFTRLMSYIACLCKKYEKPLFYYKSNVFEEIRLFDSRPQMLSVAAEIVDGVMDGVVIAGNHTPMPKWKDIVLDVVEALQLVEQTRDIEKWHSMLRMNIKSPQILPKTMMVATSLAALKTKAAAIFLLTASGRSARMLSNVSPSCPILAITAHESTVRRLHLFRKVIPLLYKGRRAVNWREECRNRVLFGSEFAMKTGLFSSGAKLVVLSRSEEGAGCCDEFEIITASG